MLHKQAVLKLRAVEYVISFFFFLISCLSLLYKGFCQKNYETTIIF